MKFTRKRIIAGMLIAAALVGGGAYLKLRKGKAITVVYREEKVTRGDLDLTVQATGTVQPENRLEIKPPIAGRVETILVKEGQKVRKGQVLAWMSSTERAALLDAARSKGEDEVRRWEELYRPTPILAPIGGTVILRNVEAGQTFSSADSVFVMSDRLTVKAQVDETDIAQVAVKQEAEIVLDAYPNQKIGARVDQIAFEAKTVNNVTTYLVDVLPEAAPEHMRSGMTANVTVFVASRKNVLFVPQAAIKVRERRKFVLIRGKGPDALPADPMEQVIETGITDGKKTEVVSGLEEGAVILIAEMEPLGAKKSGASNPFMPIRPGKQRNAGSGR